MATTNKELLLALRIRGAATHRVDSDALRKLIPILLEALGWENAEQACTFTSYYAPGQGMMRADVAILVGEGVTVNTSVMLHMGDSFACGANNVNLKQGGFSYLEMPDALHRDIMSKL